MNSRKFADPRRKHDLHWLEAVVPSLGLVACLLFLFPPWRAIILRMGVGPMFAAGAIFFGAVIALVARRVMQRSGSPGWTESTHGVDRPLRSFDLSTLKSVAGEELPEAPPAPAPMTPDLPPAAEPRRITLRLDKKPGHDMAHESLPKLKASSPIPLLSHEKSESAPNDLIERLRAVDWFQFETVVSMAYEKQGYVVTRLGGADAAGGIDMILEKDGLRTAVHCKHWKNWQVSEKSVRAFAQAVTDGEFAKGALILLRGCIGPARNLMDERGLEIVEERHLNQLLTAMNADSDPTVLALLSDKRKYCPKCESEMMLRPVGIGEKSVGQHWDCSSAPQCDYTLQAS